MPIAPPILTHQDWELVEEQQGYRGFFQINTYHLKHKQFAGGWSPVLQRELVIKRRAVAVLPYDPIRDEVVLIEQFRVGALDDENSPWLIELVAGVMDNPDESLIEVAHREVQEEANLTVKDLIAVNNFWLSPGGSNERMYLFCARVDASNAGGIYGLADEHEDIRVFTLKAELAFEAINNGRIDNAPAIIGLQWLQLNRERLQQQWNKT